MPGTSFLIGNRIDHIVYCCQNLNKGIEHITQITGAQPVYGGRHLSKGTHNAILRIGDLSYLEILAPDDQNKDVLTPRWMGIDCIGHPVITRWAIHSRAIEKEAAILQSFNSDYGKLEDGMRRMEDGSLLKWRLTDPLAFPDIDIIPFLLDWQNSQHPATTLRQECTLINLNLYHPNPTEIELLFEELEIDLEIEKNPVAQIEIILESPNGTVTI